MSAVADDVATIADLTVACLPLAAAAAPLLAFAARLDRTSESIDIAGLRGGVLGMLRDFADQTRDLPLPADALSLSQAVLAATIDDAALRTTWGVAGGWGSDPLVAKIAPNLTGEGFYADVVRLLDTPATARPVLDLVFVCLSLGLGGHCWRLADAEGGRDALREKLWRALGGTDVPQVLSPDLAGVSAPSAAPSEGLVGWARSLLRLPSPEQRALIDGLTAAPVDHEPDFDRIYRERFAEAMKAAGPILRRRGQSLARMPWHAVIGPPGVGKTSALRNAGLEHPLHESGAGEPLPGISGTRHCDVWLTGRGVFLDVAGRLALHDSDADHDRREWQGFVALLKRTRPRQPLNGIILMVSVDYLLRATPDERRLYAEALRERLIEFQVRFGMTLPTYVVLTKLDLLAGFVEFFDTLDQEWRGQALGFTLPLEPDEVGAVQGWRFSQRFDRLVERQRALAGSRLWLERDARRCALIHEFPAQLASLGRPLGEVFNRVFNGAGLSTPVSPRGVFLTSAKQEGRPVDRWSPRMAEAMRIAMPTPAAHGDAHGRAFFLHRLFGELMPGEAGLVARVNGHGRSAR